MDTAKIKKIFTLLAKAIPNPKSELIFHSNFELLTAVLLSAHSTDKTVNKVTKELFKIANTPEKILALGEHKLKQLIKPIGLYNTKAKNLIATSKILAEKYHSRLPNIREQLEALPGVGRKTSNVILNVAFGEKTIAVDTHIFRVGNRTEIAEGKNPEEVESKLMDVVPKKFLKNAHYLLLLHGRYTCKARLPLCFKCPINKLCEYENKNL